MKSNKYIPLLYLLLTIINLNFIFASLIVDQNSVSNFETNSITEVDITNSDLGETSITKSDGTVLISQGIGDSSVAVDAMTSDPNSIFVISENSLSNSNEITITRSNEVWTSVKNSDGTWTNTAKFADGSSYSSITYEPTIGVLPIFSAPSFPLVSSSIIWSESSYSPPTYTPSENTSSTSIIAVIQNICGDGIVTGLETCETPNTQENSYCSAQVGCYNGLTIQNGLGNCKNDCSCSYPSISGQCIKDSCGASCGSDNDCQIGQSCDLNSCQCVLKTGPICGNGIIEGAEICDTNQSTILQSNNFCTTKNSCIGCTIMTVVDSSNATSEICDAIDNDCNNIVDDYVLSSTLNQNGLCENQLGVCKNTQKSCAGNLGFQTCTVNNYNSSGLYESGVESMCDGFDNNCDGSVDEGCYCVPGSVKECGVSNIGVCSKGLQTCMPDGFWGTCWGDVNPVISSETICDGIDNDCDGYIDEGLLNSCGECGLIPNEICNYVDDNCNAESNSPRNATFNDDSDSYTNFSNYCPNGVVCRGVFADGIDNNNNGLIDEGIDTNLKVSVKGNYTNWCTVIPPHTEILVNQINFYALRLNFNVTDFSDLGINKTYYCISDNGECIPNLIYTGPITLTCQGNLICTKSIYFYSIDLRGSIENIQHYSLTVFSSQTYCDNNCILVPTNRYSSKCNNINGCTYYKLNNDGGVKVADVCNQLVENSYAKINETYEILCPKGPIIQNRFLNDTISLESEKCNDLFINKYNAQLNGENINLNIISCLR